MNGPATGATRPVAVVTDSSASLPADVAERWGVTVAPLWLDLDGRALRDGECSLEEVLAAERATTSGPTPGELQQMVGARLAEGFDVVVLTVAASLSGTHRSAGLALAELEREGAVGGSAGCVEVVDTGTAAAAQGLVVLAAARSAAPGAPLQEVVRAAAVASGRVRLAAGIRSLDRLVRSGRVPQAAGWAGRHLGLRPLFELREGGGIHPLRPARTREGVLERIIRRWESNRPEGAATAHLAMAHAMAPEELEGLSEQLADRGAPEPELVGGFGAAMAAHVGPGLIGLAWWWD